VQLGHHICLRNLRVLRIDQHVVHGPAGQYATRSWPRPQARTQPWHRRILPCLEDHTSFHGAILLFAELGPPSILQGVLTEDHGYLPLAINATVCWPPSPAPAGFTRLEDILTCSTAQAAPMPPHPANQRDTNSQSAPGEMRPLRVFKRECMIDFQS
jgi:hypothetical protein